MSIGAIVAASSAMLRAVDAVDDAARLVRAIPSESFGVDALLLDRVARRLDNMAAELTLDRQRVIGLRSDPSTRQAS